MSMQCSLLFLPCLEWWRRLSIKSSEIEEERSEEPADDDDDNDEPKLLPLPCYTFSHWLCLLCFQIICNGS